MYIFTSCKCHQAIILRTLHYVEYFFTIAKVKHLHYRIIRTYGFETKENKSHSSFYHLVNHLEYILPDLLLCICNRTVELCGFHSLLFLTQKYIMNISVWVIKFLQCYS